MAQICLHWEKLTKGENSVGLVYENRFLALNHLHTNNRCPIRFNKSFTETQKCGMMKHCVYYKYLSHVKQRDFSMRKFIIIILFGVGYNRGIGASLCVQCKCPLSNNVFQPKRIKLWTQLDRCRGPNFTPFTPLGAF
jgi:hypothetical protein